MGVSRICFHINSQRPSARTAHRRLAALCLKAPWWGSAVTLLAAMVCANGSDRGQHMGEFLYESVPKRPDSWPTYALSGRKTMRYSPRCAAVRTETEGRHWTPRRGLWSEAERAANGGGRSPERKRANPHEDASRSQRGGIQPTNWREVSVSAGLDNWHVSPVLVHRFQT